MTGASKPFVCVKDSDSDKKFNIPVDDNENISIEHLSEVFPNIVSLYSHEKGTECPTLINHDGVSFFKPSSGWPDTVYVLNKVDSSPQIVQLCQEISHLSNTTTTQFTEIIKEIKELNNKLLDTKLELKKDLMDTKLELTLQLNNQIANVKEEFRDKLDDTKEKIFAKIDTKVDNVKDALEKKINETKTDLENKFENKKILYIACPPFGLKNPVDLPDTNFKKIAKDLIKNLKEKKNNKNKYEKIENNV